jgi:DNA-packaging protein gp3
MLYGILIIINNVSHFFQYCAELKKLIDDYFDYIEGDYYEAEKPAKDGKTTTIEKIWDRDPEPPTLAGLMLFLGFTSRQLFDSYCTEGEFADVLNRGRLRIEACYEKKLHSQSATGAIFALKSLGWNEKPEITKKDAEIFKTLKIEIIETGPTLAANEKEVVL